VFTRCGTKNARRQPTEYAKEMVERGAGEIFLNSIDRDGLMSGFDLDLIREVATAVSVPVVACGGAGSVADLAAGVDAGASAVAAGSLFVLTGPHRAVLISYPSSAELHSAFRSPGASQ